ncbi:MAG: hypothetical protein GQ534_03890 [Candidatus Delongbacteria bacterium]|nr:hypothetical protein [Candidatus Delongbacteria bacterium]
MKAEEIRSYLDKLKKFNEWELEQKLNYDPEICVQRVLALYEFGMKNFSKESIKKHLEEHLDNLIRTQSIFRKINDSTIIF